MTRNTRASFLTPRREYPGYDFRSGYGSADSVEADYIGLGLLLKETRDAFGSGASARVLSMAYYPDGRQEQLLKKQAYLCIVILVVQAVCNYLYP